jgi:hypothetical protein
LTRVLSCCWIVAPGTVQEYVEHGQLLTLKVENWATVYGD